MHGWTEQDNVSLCDPHFFPCVSRFFCVFVCFVVLIGWLRGCWEETFVKGAIQNHWFVQCRAGSWGTLFLLRIEMCTVDNPAGARPASSYAFVCSEAMGSTGCAVLVFQQTDPGPCELHYYCCGCTCQVRSLLLSQLLAL